MGSKAKLIMAAQRISASSVNWEEFARKIPAAQKASFQAFKQKSDGFVRAVNALPEAAPKIDFDAYRSRIAVPGMVDDFQKKYEALQIPYPKDNATAALDAQLVAKKAEYTKFVAESDAKIAEIQTELDKWEKMRPFTDMCFEELARQAPQVMGKLGVKDPVQHRNIKNILKPKNEIRKNEKRWVWITNFIWLYRSLEINAALCSKKKNPHFLKKKKKKKKKK